MHPKSSRRGRTLLVISGFIVFAAILFFLFQKLNNKINSLHNAVVSLEGYLDKSIEDMHRENAAAHSRLSVVPDLSSHGNGWKVTQFGDVEGQQEMCYTISTDTGLAIIDGGWDYEVDRLRRIIASYGNSVDAWIITHPHNDHITAFLEIYKDPQGIAIHHVYTPQMPELSVLESNAGWDDYSLLEEFRSLQIPQLEYLYTGDERNILGLKMKVLSACSEEIDSISNDLMNDGSLVFRIDGKQDSMIFCADAGSAAGNPELSSLILEDFKEHLKCDYIQMGHHGFGGLSQDFYRAAAPKAAFFDSPAWLLSGEDVRSCKENEEFMESMGCTIFSFYTTPNQILFR